MSHPQRTCMYYLQNGLCKYGTACKLLHERSPAAQPPNYEHRQWSHAQASTSAQLGRDALQHGNGPAAGPCRGEGPMPVALRVMCYNILADQLAHDHAHELYRAAPQWCLAWAHRQPLLLAEIAHWHPDLGCLQEVDHPTTFRDALDALGYRSAYGRRTGNRIDGCLTFWRADRFQAVHMETIELQEHSLRDNVALFIALRPLQPGGAGPASHLPACQVSSAASSTASGGVTAQRGTGEAMGSADPVRDETAERQQDKKGASPNGMDCIGATEPAAADAVALPGLLVGNTHLLFNPKRGDLKVAQARVILSRMAALAGAVLGPNAHALLLGDLNSCPGSGVYRYVAGGALDLAAEDRRMLSGQLEGRGGWPPAWLRQQGGPSWLGGCARASAPQQAAPLGFARGGCLQPVQGGPDRVAMPTLGASPASVHPAPSALPMEVYQVPPLPLGEPWRERPASAGNNDRANVALTPGPTAPPFLHRLPRVPHRNGFPHGPTSPPGSWPRPPHAPVAAAAAPGGSPWDAAPLASSPDIIHSHSFSGAISRMGSNGSAAGAALPMFAYVDAYGQQYHSPVPPMGIPLAERQPFYYDPMRVEEPAPPSWPRTLAHSASHARRMTNLSTWTREQLRMVVGPRPAVHSPPSPAFDRAGSGQSAGTSDSSQHGPGSAGGGRAIVTPDGETWVATHPLQLQSAYAVVLGAEPQYTSCHGKFIGTVDYVWYTPAAISATPSPTLPASPASPLPVRAAPPASMAAAQPAQRTVTPSADAATLEGGGGGRRGSRLRALRVLLPPPLDSLHCGLPSPEWASDHISLLVDFELMPAGGQAPMAGEPVLGAASLPQPGAGALAETQGLRQPESSGLAEVPEGSAMDSKTLAATQALGWDPHVSVSASCPDLARPPHGPGEGGLDVVPGRGIPPPAALPDAFNPQHIRFLD